MLHELPKAQSFTGLKATAKGRCYLAYCAVVIEIGGFERAVCGPDMEGLRTAWKAITTAVLDESQVQRVAIFSQEDIKPL